jgi:hypothetical protein
MLVRSVWRWNQRYPRNFDSKLALQEFRERFHRNDSSLANLRVVATLSSFRGRVQNSEPTLRSLLDQSFPLSKIYISVPKTVHRIDSDGELPAFIEELHQSSGGIVTMLEPVDFGPSTKLLGALMVEKDPDTILVTVDDDVVYHEDAIMALVAVITHPELRGQVCSIFFLCRLDSLVRNLFYM